jgi:hypothetical protein
LVGQNAKVAEGIDFVDNRRIACYRHMNDARLVGPIDPA